MVYGETFERFRGDLHKRSNSENLKTNVYKKCIAWAKMGLIIQL